VSRTDATLLLTLVLVGITAYYAWQNRQMVQEMRATRSLQVLPKLALQWHGVGPTVSFIRIVNVGPGPALNVDLKLRFVPHDQTNPIDERTLQSNLIAPGEHWDVIPGRNGVPDMERLAAQFDRIELSGSCEDALAEPHSVCDALSDIGRWREIQKDARVRWEDPNREKRLAEALDKKFGKALKDLSAAAQRLKS